jgi:hypothetical protein
MSTGSAGPATPAARIVGRRYIEAISVAALGAFC